MASQFLVAIVAIVVLLASPAAYAYDPSPLQDFCIAAPKLSAAVLVNGMICKDPKLASAQDFSTSGLNIPGNTTNPLGTAVNVVDINRLPGLNTLGLSLVRVDFAPNGLIPPHTHPRATEMILLLEGTLYCGFVESNPSNDTKKRLFAKILKPGDVFVFPMGLIHFLLNVGKTKAVVIAIFNSQNAGVVTLANDVFGTEPSISPDVLTKSFQLDKKVIDYLQSRLWPGPNVTTS